MGLKEEILAQSDLGFVEVVVPEWGGLKIRLKAMSGAERDQYELDSYQESTQAKKEQRNPRNVRSRMLVRCIVDEAGAPAFSGTDIDALGDKSAAALDRLYDAARKLNGFTQADAEALAKN